MKLSQQESQRYARHFTLPQIGEAGQLQLKKASLLCVGAGGLGCALLQYAVAAGVGKIGIVDDDEVVVSNLQRQILYADQDIGEKKVVVAKRKLLDVNPHTTIDIYTEKLTENNATEIISSYDIIIDCTDNFFSRYLINDCCVILEKPFIFASIHQFEGLCSVFPGKNGPCYRCLFPTPPTDSIANCADAGVLGVLPGLLGTLQATEAIKLILNIGEPLIGKLLRINALTMEFQKLTLNVNPTCEACVQRKSFAELNRSFVACNLTEGKEMFKQITVPEFKQLQENETVFVLDVREPHEYEKNNLGGYLIPLNELSNRLNEIDKDKKIVVHCKAGGRSQRAAALLAEAGFENVYNLQGGILAFY